MTSKKAFRPQSQCTIRPPEVALSPYAAYRRPGIRHVPHGQPVYAEPRLFPTVYRSVGVESACDVRLPGGCPSNLISRGHQTIARPAYPWYAKLNYHLRPTVTGKAALFSQRIRSLPRN